MSEPIRSLAERYPRLRRASVLFLVAGGIAVWLFLKPHLPHDHPVAYRFDPEPAGVTSLEAAWTRTDNAEAVAGARYQWRAGEAPKELHVTVRGPDGEYDVEVAVRSGNTEQRTSARVTLGEHITRLRVLTPQPSASAPAASSSSALPPASAPAASSR